MACPEYEDRIMEMQEGTLPIADRLAVEDHLHGCEVCRQFSHRLNELDALMTTACRTPGPSPDFKARLMQRIDQEVPGLTAEAIEARKREMESEFDAFMTGLPHRVWLARLPLLLDVLGSISVAILAVLVLRSELGRLPSLEAIDSLLIKCTTGCLAWIWVGASLVTGLLWTFRRHLIPRL